MLLFPLAIVHAAESASVTLQGEWTLLGPLTAMTTGLMAELALRSEAPDPALMTSLGLDPGQQAQVQAAREALARGTQDPEVAQVRQELEALRNNTVEISGTSLTLRFAGSETELFYSVLKDTDTELQVMTVEKGGSELITFTFITPDLVLMLEADQQVPLVLARR